MSETTKEPGCIYALVFGLCYLTVWITGIALGAAATVAIGTYTLKLMGIDL